MDTLSALAENMVRHVRADGVHATAIPRLFLIRSDRPTEPLHVLHQPALCLVAQGRKEVMVGREVVRYGAGEHLTVPVDLPVVGEVIEASPEKPYLCLRIDLDPVILGELVGEAAPPNAGDGAPGMIVERSTPELVEAATRMVRLLDARHEAAVLAPLVERELLFRALMSGHSVRLRQIAYADSALRRVGRAIERIKETYRQPFSIASLAAAAGMSPSSLHQHFKSVTKLRPLQYQKQLRLQKARRLMASGALDAAGAAHEVGYDSPSQFSREYRRLFGVPPARDAASLRARFEAPSTVAAGALT